MTESTFGFGEASQMLTAWSPKQTKIKTDLLKKKN